MPGLRQAAILAYQHLKNCLEPCGHKPMPGTVGLWGHDKRPTKFCLCVDNFGIKYWSDDDANHLCNAIGANFKHTTDRKGINYCGLTIDWNYALGHVDVPMPNYVQEAQKKLNYDQKVFPQHSPHKHLPIKYGVKGSQQLHVEPKKDHLLQTNKIKPM